MKQAIIELTAAVRELAAAIKEGKEEKSPTPPNKKKPQETNNNNKPRAREKFVKPTVEEIEEYVRQKGYNIDAERFWNYYESKGWVIGRNTMKSWKSACVTWMKNKESDPRFREIVDSTEEPSDNERKRKQLAAIDQLLGRKEAQNG